MKLKNHLNLFLVLILVLVSPIQRLHSQVTIGSGIEPAKGALLDLKETDETGGGDNSDKGVLFPRVHLTDMDKLKPMLSGADLDDSAQKLKHKGLVVYNINETAPFVKGLYGWDGAKWASLANSWNLTGNAGTDPSVNFLGTTDDKDLVFKRNNLLAGYLGGNGDPDTHNTVLGVGAFKNAPTIVGYSVAVGNNSLANTTGENNTAVGHSTLRSNTTGGSNTAIGISSQALNTTGSTNTSVGIASLRQNIIGQSNTALGSYSLEKSTGMFNTATGSNSLQDFTSGDYNTAIGHNAGSDLVAGSYNIAIGASTQLPANVSNQMNIGNAIFGTNMSGSLATPAGNIGIGTSSPDVSAALEVDATNKGFLPPRVSLTGVSDNTTIPNPATGLLVFNTGTVLDQNAYYYNSKTPATPVWTLLQPYRADAGVLVKKILYSSSSAPAEDKSVSIGPFKFTMDGTGPKMALITNPGVAKSYTALIYQVWDANTGSLNTGLSSTYDMTTVTISNTAFVSFGIGGVAANTGEQNHVTLTDPDTGKIYEVKFLLLNRGSTNYYGIIASEY